MKILMTVMDGAMINEKHYPLIATLSAFLIAVGGLRIMHDQSLGYPIFYTSLGLFTLNLLMWATQTYRNQKSSLALGMKLLIVATLMFLFSYALVPFYHVVCRVLGIKSEITQSDHRPTHAPIHTEIPVTTLITHGRGMDWKVRISPKQDVLKNNTLMIQHIHLYNPNPRQEKTRIKVAMVPSKLSQFLHPMNPIQNKVVTLNGHGYTEIKVEWLLSGGAPKLKESTIHYALFPIQSSQGEL